MNNSANPKKTFAVSSIFSIIAIIFSLGANAFVVSAMRDPFANLNIGSLDYFDVNTVSQTDIVSQTDAVNQSKVSASDIANVSDSDAKLLYPQYPYYIEVDTTNEIITVYTTSSSGKYDKVVRYMLCSTSSGAASLKEGYWKLTDDRSTSEEVWYTVKSSGKQLHVKYATHTTGSYYFLSAPYSDSESNALDKNSYSKLGSSNTTGCIMLTVENAKWICENCKSGTTVQVVKKEANPELTAALKAQVPAPEASGWDPTDPDPANPNYQPQYTEEDPETEGYLVDNLGLNKITYNDEKS